MTSARPNQIRIALSPADYRKLLDMLGDQENSLVYRLRAKYLEHIEAQEEAETTAGLAMAAKKRVTKK